MLVKRCACCSGVGTVEAATGEQRPCSRCRTVEFSAWSDARRPRPDAERPAAQGGAA